MKAIEHITSVVLMGTKFVIVYRIHSGGSTFQRPRLYPATNEDEAEALTGERIRCWHLTRRWTADLRYVPPGQSACIWQALPKTKLKQIQHPLLPGAIANLIAASLGRACATRIAAACLFAHCAVHGRAGKVSEH